MELSISNNFLDLFIPEQSSYSKEELIDIFKTYIFKLMNMDIESLIQEQINNDRENIELHKKYKDFFTGKVDSILKINNLYKSIKDRTEIIKNAIDENNKIIANTKNNNENLIEKENNILMKDFQMNKKIIKNYGNNPVLRIYNIPYYMIDCFKTNEYEAYLKYYKFVMEKLPKNKYSNFEKLKGLVVFINYNIINFIKNLLSINYDINIPYNKIFDLLQMKPNNIFLPFNKKEDEINNDIKILSVFLLQIDLWTKHYNISLNNKKADNDNNNNDNTEERMKNILNFFEMKIKIISKEINDTKIKEIFFKYIFDNYIYDYINYIYSIEQYSKAYLKINLFIKNSNINSISNSVSYNIYKISKIYFFKYLYSIFNFHKEILINYLSTFINIKNFFESRIPIIPKTSSNKDLLDLKYEIFFIFENNFNYLYKIISDEIIFKFGDKVKTIKNFLEHVDELVGLINDFLYKHGFVLLSDQNLVKEYNEFKNILNKVVEKHKINVINFFGIKQNFSGNFHMNNLNTFNGLLNEIQDLI